ncbi:MAG: hypothetical protein NTX87_04565 [Planctomycetota bacterium]|nr:hypothetical protein [Planctomycetota bacterium]
MVGAGPPGRIQAGARGHRRPRPGRQTRRPARPAAPGQGQRPLRRRRSAGHAPR